MSRFSSPPSAISPLEQFLRDYVELREGAWDEIEPQVYDVLLGPDMLQLAFDPEALSEHPQAQLCSFGSPMTDRLLRDAAERGSHARLYMIGLHLQPHALESAIRRSIHLPPDARLDIERARVLDFPQAVFWFEATFTSDQKEQEIVPIAIDLHYAREVRQIEPFLAAQRLSEAPAIALPEVRRISLPSACRVAREKILRTVRGMASSRQHELSSRVERQISRMMRYYGQLRSEIDEQAARADNPAKYEMRREAIDREQHLRIAEVRQKSTVRVHLRLANFLLVHQPKLLIRAQFADRRRTFGCVELVWDPLFEVIEAPSCPQCARPTFALRVDRRGRIGCPECTPALALARV